jgi:hypothetical protein
MNVDIRKAIKFRTLRFEHARPRIRKSTGASSNARGAYVHVGESGIYYGRRTDWKLADADSPPDGTSSDSDAGDGLYTQATGLVTSSAEEVAAQVNSLARRRTYTPLIVILATIAAVALAALALLYGPQIISSYGQAGYVAFILFLAGSLLVWSAGLGLAWFTHRQAQTARNVTLRYSLDPDVTKLFDCFENALAALNRSARLWHVVAPVPDWDWQRNVGDSSLLKRKRVKVELAYPPALQVGVKAYCINLGARQVYFLPDQVLTCSGGRYSAASVLYLNVRVYRTRYIEKWHTPRDATRIQHTWEPVRPDGGRPSRFWRKWQRPIAQYGQVDLTSSTGLELHFQVSNLAIAEQFVQALSTYTNYCRKPRAIAFPSAWAWAEDSSRPEVEGQPSPNGSGGEKELSPHEVLRVEPGATLDAITEAYRKLAHQYHPDRMMDLAPELRELAEKRMKAINIAYQQMKREANVRWV